MLKTPKDRERLEIFAPPLCLRKTPKVRERLEISALPPYRRGHDHDSFHRRFHTRLPASSPRLLGTRAHRAATSGECPAVTAPRSDLALLHGPTSLGLALPDLAAGPNMGLSMSSSFFVEVPFWIWASSSGACFDSIESSGCTLTNRSAGRSEGARRRASCDTAT